MKLHTKAFFTIGATSIGLIIILFLLSQNVLMSSYLELEKKDTTNNINRVISAKNKVLEELDTLNIDWSAWNDTYEFMNDVNAGGVVAVFLNLSRYVIMQ